MKLTDAKLRSLKATGKVQKIADGGGLYIHVTAVGAKLWRMGYRFGGKQKTLALGKYPDVSLVNARKRRDEARALLAEGIDPAEHKKEARAAAIAEQLEKSLTFEVVAREWYATKTTLLSEKYRHQLLIRLERNVFPYIGAVPFSSLEPAAILEAVRHTERRGAHELAHRLMQLIGKICRYARIVGYAKYDAASGLAEALTPTPKVRHHASITDPVALGHLLRAIDAYQGEPSISFALRILPYVFVRSGELRGARWPEINLETGEWLIPAERMKMKRPHLVPLAPQVVKLFQGVREFSGHDVLVFPGQSSRTRCITDMGLLNALRRMGFGKDEMTVHGFRSTASTILNEQGFRADVIEAQLAHAERNAVRDAYNRAVYLPERRAMMKAWADYLDGLRAQSGKPSAGELKP